MTDEEWRDEAMHCFGMLLDGRAQTTGIRQRGQDATILIVLNAYHDLVNFNLPGEAAEARWLLLADTNMSGQPADAAKTSFSPTDSYGVTGRSVVVFRLEAESDAAIDRSKPGRSPRHSAGS
jgi:isoamylase